MFLPLWLILMLLTRRIYISQILSLIFLQYFRYRKVFTSGLWYLSSSKVLYDHDIVVWELSHSCSSYSSGRLEEEWEPIMIFYYRSYNNFTPNYFTLSTRQQLWLVGQPPPDQILPAGWRIRQYFIGFSINVTAKYSIQTLLLTPDMTKTYI